MINGERFIDSLKTRPGQPVRPGDTVFTTANGMYALRNVAQGGFFGGVWLDNYQHLFRLTLGVSYTDVLHYRDNNKALTENFEYDELNRLVRDQIGTTTAVVTYDSYGNIVTKNGLTYTYGNNAGPHAATSVGGVSYTFDANGNNRTGDGRTIAYSVFDKPLSITKGGFTSRFHYGLDRDL